MENLTEKQKAKINYINSYLKDMAFGDMFEELMNSRAISGTPVNAVNASVNLTVATHPTAGDEMVIAGKTYTFVALGTAAAEGDIDIGADLAAAKLAIVAAINGTDGINTAHTLVTAAAFETNVCAITVTVAGISGNDLETTETFDSDNNVFSADVTAGGINGTIGNKHNRMMDASYWYVCIADNTIADKNWRRFSVGSVF